MGIQMFDFMQWAQELGNQSPAFRQLGSHGPFRCFADKTLDSQRFRSWTPDIIYIHIYILHTFEQRTCTIGITVKDENTGREKRNNVQSLPQVLGFSVSICKSSTAYRDLLSELYTTRLRKPKQRVHPEEQPEPLSELFNPLGGRTNCGSRNRELSVQFIRPSHGTRHPECPVRP